MIVQRWRHTLTGRCATCGGIQVEVWEDSDNRPALVIYQERLAAAGRLLNPCVRCFMEGREYVYPEGTRR